MIYLCISKTQNMGTIDIFIIREFKVIGATFETYQKITLPEDEVIIQRDKIIKAGGWEKSNHYYSLSLKPKGYNAETTKHLPYFATVKEDLPISAGKLTPKVYPNCQLTTQKPGGYLVFKCLDSGAELKIAMNSHTYTP